MGSPIKTGLGDHPALGLLKAFVRADGSEEESLAVRRHLAESHCLHCLLELNRLSVETRAHESAMLGEILRSVGRGEERRARLRQIAVRAERQAYLKSIEDLLAPDLLADLLLRPQGGRRQAVRSLKRFQLLGLADHLIERARCEVFEDLARASELGGLAVEVAEALSPAVYGKREVATTQGRAWGALGNALRVRSELREAERALSLASDLVGTQGHGAASDRADLLSLVGSLRVSQARYAEATVLLRQAAALYASQRDRLSEARVLVQLGKASGDDGSPDDAISALERAEEILRDEDSGPLSLFARQGRATYLNETGRTREARDLLEALRPDWNAQLPQFVHQQRLQWLEARILWSEGDLVAAEQAFLTVQRGWEERDEAYEYALVSLELAALYLEQGRSREVRELAERMLPIFHSQEIHRHAMAALVLVQRVVANDTATGVFLQDVLRYLKRARSNPDLAYSPRG